MPAHARAPLVTRVVFGIALAVQALHPGTSAIAAAPVVFHTPHFESPVRGGPDDLLFLGGSGFHADDRVVYKAISEGEKLGTHPAAVPARSTRELGTAAVVKLADPPYSLTILLPQVLAADTMYRLWVVNAASEWSVPFTINDPRPLWVSPAYVHATVDFAQLGRRIRVIGRNLEPVGTTSGVRVRLQGLQTYILEPDKAAADARLPSLAYVAEAQLPQHVTPGTYTVSVSRNGRGWTEVPEQKLTVLPDPPGLAHFNIDDPRFGSCRADDGADDSGCFAKAIAAAQQAGGGTVAIPAGTWDLYSTSRGGEADFVLTADVNVEGAGSDETTLVRRISQRNPSSAVLLLLEGNNSVARLKFMDEQRFTSFENKRAIIKLGHRWDDPRIRDGKVPGAVRRVAISQNLFRQVNIAVVDDGLPIEQLFVTHNDFGGYARGLELPGMSHSARNLFRIEDSVIRWNRFVPGSYIDVSIGQGVLATGLGGSRRVDFSSNDADGTTTEALQDPSDQHGWRAAFFWNMHDSGEMLLVADNRISCPGDKAGDGEAIAFDANGDTFGYEQAAEVTASEPRSVTVRGDLLAPPSQWAAGRDSYYAGHWIEVVAGPGLGQTRRIQSYRSDPARRSVVFQVHPAWDVAPQPGQTRLVVARQFWQTYVVGNEITQATPPCRKSNLSGPRGGEITMWAPSADSVFDANRQFDTSGLGFTQGYSVHVPSCPTCSSHSAVQTALEIRGNLVHGEYDWSSSCSLSGIHGTFGASPTPEAPPPIVSFGVQVTRNVIEHSDGLHGGAIDIVPTWHRGPEPVRWPLIDNLILSHNVIRDIDGSPPREACHYAQSGRSGIRIEGGADVIGTVLYKNSCERVRTALDDGGVGTTRVCGTTVDSSCECNSAAK
jgi:hypothetical protein